jgi:hypothetical protein
MSFALEGGCTVDDGRGETGSVVLRRSRMSQHGLYR